MRPPKSLPFFAVLSTSCFTLNQQGDVFTDSSPATDNSTSGGITSSTNSSPPTSTGSGDAGTTDAITDGSDASTVGVTGGGDTSTSSSTTEVGSSSSGTTGDGTTTQPPACNNNGTCDGGESLDTCPDDCTVCGDGVKSEGEECDNKMNMDAAYTPTKPMGRNLCADGCKAVRFCGDSVADPEEKCDEGGVQTKSCEANCLAPKCGDKVINVQVDEICDDGNEKNGDGCADDCLPERRVFVSSGIYKGDMTFSNDNMMNLKGIVLADARCSALASTAKLPGVYKAWLSDGSQSPSTRFDDSFKGHYRLGSEGFPVVATGWADLVDGTLKHSINVTELKTVLDGSVPVWTNTLSSGKIASNTDHCVKWTAVSQITTVLGDALASNGEWTNLPNKQVCSSSNRLYCFQNSP